MPDLFDNISDWLLNQALGDEDISVTVGGLAKRLQDGGIPISRISMGRSVLHPVIALIDLQWSSDTGQVQLSTVPRKSITQEFLEGSPFGDIALGRVKHIVADLKNPDDVNRYEMFQKFAEDGLTGYVAFVRNFGREQAVFSAIAGNVRGANVSFATRRFSGFSQSDIDGLERLVSALCVCTRVDNDRFLAKEILGAYLGHISGDQVLGGQVERGDGQQIDCAIFYSDLCGSVALSQQLTTSTYLDTVNAYFDCTVNAVLDHGGEVLKLIGDGVLAIFPVDDKTRPRENMCAAALASAREAFARASHLNKSRARDELPDLKFGIALHVGKVIYGNVGTEKRLDFTATGAAVGLAARIEALTRTLDAQLLATKEFADYCPDESIVVPAQVIKDFPDPVELVSFEV
jgi:adenylate cyclase